MKSKVAQAIDMLDSVDPVQWPSCLDALREVERFQKRIDRLELLAEFGEKVLEEVKECIAQDGFEIEAHELADMAVEIGLMQFIPYDPKVHGDAGIEGDLGDKIYWWGKQTTGT